MGHQEVTNLCIEIVLKFPDPKPLTGTTMQVYAWLLTLMHFFIAVHTPFMGNNIAQAC